MVYLTEMHKITILQMIGYGDRTRTEGRSCSPISRKISGVAADISRYQKQFRERGHVRQLKKNPPNKLSDDQKLDVMLMLEENPHTSSRQTASALNISHSSILSENQMHPYKLVPTNELAEDNFDRRIIFCVLYDHAYAYVLRHISANCSHEYATPAYPRTFSLRNMTSPLPNLQIQRGPSETYRLELRWPNKTS
ncbi:hypothetical protein NQ318_017522 [Aromia moschata]|uniref:Transposase n=1 Tax=Aromia moschata TaxID=1265417 RepID=A0AAV8Z0S7_9CUCU|nr:hypothetical protein NQ318_017522 [Aromia moschata]